MPVEFKLLGKSDHLMETDRFGSVYTTQGPFRPDIDVYTVPLFQYLTDDGTSTGSNDMAITTGTLANPVEFYIEADPTETRIITTLSFYIEGTNASLREFGTGTTLTNGCVLYYKSETRGLIQISPELKSNAEFVRYCSGYPAYGTGTEAFRVTNFAGAAEGFIPTLDLTKLFPPYGVTLKAGSKERLTMHVRDDTLTGRASAFDVFAILMETLPAPKVNK